MTTAVRNTLWMHAGLKLKRSGAACSNSCPPLEPGKEREGEGRWSDVRRLASCSLLPKPVTIVAVRL